MKIRSIAHKGLKLLIEKDDGRRLPAEQVQKIRDVLSMLTGIESISEFFRLPKGKPHVLKGDREGMHSITVQANWRITFRHDPGKNVIQDLNFEDYH